ncbi:hypothetical protein PRIPAC_90532, partial [Pristionchus pacificus]|uniref:Uncharacterized protein n=1 Tax=Pristionchus pacificus TaxID=54126 RepID=A0A2A6CJF0_PRIPA
IERFSHLGIDRRSSPIGVNCGLERLNSRLKHQHLKSSGNSRLDHTMFQCVEMVNDMFERNFVADARNLVGGRYRLQASHTRHQEAIDQFSSVMVEAQSEVKFHVTSSNKKRKYVVTRHRDCPCQSMLNNHCTRCLACPYSWVCQCQDTRKAGVLCKHVHACLIYGGALQGDEDALDKHCPGDPQQALVPISTDQPERAADDATEHGHNPHIPDAGLEASQPTNFDDFPPPELDGDDLGIVPLNMVADETGDERARSAVDRDDEERRQRSKLESLLNESRIALQSIQKSNLEDGNKFLEELDALITSHRRSIKSSDLARRLPIVPGRPSNVVPIRVPSGLKKRADVRRERHLAAPPVLPVRFESDKLESELCAICHSKYPPNQGDEAVDENQQQPEFPWHYCEKICKLWMHDACIAEKHPNIDKCYTCNRVF